MSFWRAVLLGIGMEAGKQLTKRAAQWWHDRQFNRCAYCGLHVPPLRGIEVDGCVFCDGRCNAAHQATKAQP